MELVEGRPKDKRIDKEERVYDLLDQILIINALTTKKQIRWKYV